MKRRELSWVLLLWLTCSAAIAQQAKTAEEPKEIAIRGRAYCACDYGSRAAGQDCEPHCLVLEASDGKTYSFIPDDSATRMLADARVRKRQLQITARLHLKDRLEVVKIQSIKRGKLYDLYYFCEVCNITSYAPGLCPCCRQEMKLVEVPASQP
jgi:rubrerythrin